MRKLRFQKGWELKLVHSLVYWMWQQSIWIPGLHEAMYCGTEEPGIPPPWASLHLAPTPLHSTLTASLPRAQYVLLFQFHIQWCWIAILSFFVVGYLHSIINKVWKQTSLESWLTSTTLYDLQLITQPLCSFSQYLHFLIYSWFYTPHASHLTSKLLSIDVLFRTLVQPRI